MLHLLSLSQDGHGSRLKCPCFLGCRIDHNFVSVSEIIFAAVVYARDFKRFLLYPCLVCIIEVILSLIFVSHIPGSRKG